LTLPGKAELTRWQSAAGSGPTTIAFHVNEAPMMEQKHFRHLQENDTYIRPEDFPVVDDLLDWMIDKQRQGWKMVDSIPRLQNIKGFMRGGGERWG
jgi:hypothetical protein